MILFVRETEFVRFAANGTMPLDCRAPFHMQCRFVGSDLANQRDKGALTGNWLSACILAEASFFKRRMAAWAAGRNYKETAIPTLSFPWNSRLSDPTDF